MAREKLFLNECELEKLGFTLKGNGDDPRDFWQEIELSKTCENEILTLDYDAYCDFSLCHPGFVENIPLNFKTINEIKLFIDVFKREYNHAFSGLIYIIEKLNN